MLPRKIQTNFQCFIKYQSSIVHSMTNFPNLQVYSPLFVLCLTINKMFARTLSMISLLPVITLVTADGQSDVHRLSHSYAIWSYSQRCKFSCVHIVAQVQIVWFVVCFIITGSSTYVLFHIGSYQT